MDDFNKSDQKTKDQPIGGRNGWGVAGDLDEIWAVADLRGNVFEGERHSSHGETANGRGTFKDFRKHPITQRCT
ncbi:MAG TPA: hypothetical protein VF573_23235 [Paraburkholderia sp.]|uniref:hypothetical protein n=1 Tax=Paraburkholderia sp. TaxID=1926495 RepID=UPI002ED45909